MLRYSENGKGIGIYKPCNKVDAPNCEIMDCENKADWTIVQSTELDSKYHTCDAHLLTKEYVLNGKCDGCRKFSFDKWLCTVMDKGNRNIVTLCKTCKRKLRKSLET